MCPADIYGDSLPTPTEEGTWEAMELIKLASITAG